MTFLLAVGLSFIPAFCYATIVYWLDRFEKEPWVMLVGVFVWGALVATGGAIIWSSLFQVSIVALTGSQAVGEFSGTTLVAPLVEESLKGLGVVIVFLAFRHEFDSVLDGIVYAAIVALGFAATENVLYLYFSGYQEGGLGGLLVLFVLRVILGGWSHAVYTAFIGIGLAVSRLSRNTLVRLAAPFVGWCVAVFLHGLHNTMVTLLVGSLGLSGFIVTLFVDWVSWIVVLAIIVWAIFRERHWIATYLRDEVDQGTISATQYQAACSFRAQFGAYVHGWSHGHPQATRRMYQLCAELAQKKHQLATIGDERGNTATITRLRHEIAQLAPQVM